MHSLLTFCGILISLTNGLYTPLSSSLSAPTGALLGIRYIDYTIEVVTIDIATGAMQPIDTKLNNSDGYVFASTSTADNKGNYYVALMTSNLGSQLFAVNAKSGQTLKVSTLQNIYYILGFDPKTNAIYGVEEGTEKISSIYKIDPTTFAETKIGSFPNNSTPFIIQSAYDPLSSIMYDMMLTGGFSYYYGVSVTDGSLVANAPIPYDNPNTPIMYDLFCDEAKGRLISISQDKVSPNSYFLSEIKVAGNSATVSRIGTTEFAELSFYPTVSGMSSDMRQYYALMSNTTVQPINYDWYVIDIDSGDILYHVHDWTLVPPVNIQYVKYV